MTQKKKTLFTYILVCAVATLQFLYSDAALYHARASLELCAKSLIPSLFPYLVLSELIIKSGLGVRIGRFFSAPAQKLFGVGGEGACAFFCGALCGFPIGTLAAVSLYERGSISKKEAEHLLLFCNNTGPGFLISGVGAALFGSARFGVVLYVVQLLSAIIIGALSKKFFVLPKSKEVKHVRSSSLVGAPLFTEAISSAAKNMVPVCGYIVFFSVLSGVLSSFLPKIIMSGFFEISSGCLAASELLASDVPTVLCAATCAFIVGWSGLSVHAQAAAICKKADLSLVPYIVVKLFQGILCFLLVFLYFTIFSESALPVFAAGEKQISVLPFFFSFGVNILFIFATIKNLIKKCSKKRLFVIL